VNPGFVSVVTIAKVVWVLERAYRLADQDIAAALERMLQIEVLVVENELEVFAAMVELKRGRGTFADALIAELGKRSGCTFTLTFDKKARRLPSFKRA
jgi:predicted nucleic-acid-binding protein